MTLAAALVANGGSSVAKWKVRLFTGNADVSQHPWGALLRRTLRGPLGVNAQRLMQTWNSFLTMRLWLRTTEPIEAHQRHGHAGD